MNKILSKYLSLIIWICSPLFLFAQQNTKTEPNANLFVYPTVPDSIQTLENRSNYFITHFWDSANFGTQINDTEAFEKAFNDYIVFFRYAHRNVVRSSISNLVNIAQANMQNFWMVANAAEKYLYSEDATLRSDEAYTIFINSFLRSSNLKKKEKTRFQKQLVKINANQVGVIAPNFTAFNVDGEKWVFEEFTTDSATTVILFFTPEECSDCNIPRLRLSTNVDINNMIQNGEVVFINVSIGKYSPDWAEKAKTYSPNWISLISESAFESYNIPSSKHTIYILDKDKIIQNKNINATTLINAIN